MGILNISIVKHLLSVLLGLICATITFISIPLLTKITIKHSKNIQYHHVLITQRRPPPPPPPENDQKIEQQKRQQPQKAQKRQNMPQPELNIPTSNLTADLGGTIAISGLLKSDFVVSDSLFLTAFKPIEVDQPPRLLRAMLPQYPSDALKKGIEGRVMLRFVVDCHGKVQEPQVLQAEPEGIFEASALAAVVKYRFKPAMKGGKAVDCIVKLPIGYDLNT